MRNKKKEKNADAEKKQGNRNFVKKYGVIDQ
jgi:hypothetical protein